MRGRVQIGLILGMLAAFAAAAGFSSVTTSRTIPGAGTVAFAQDGGDEGDGAEGEAPAEGEETPPATEEPAADEAKTAPPEKTDLVSKVRSQEHGPDVYELHAKATPNALTSFDTEGVAGITYAGAESEVAQTTEKIRSIDVAEAAERKYEYADSFLAPNTLEREDPLEITDAIPEELRNALTGQGEFGDLSDRQLLQFLVSILRSELQNWPIRVIGTIDNGVDKFALVEIAGVGKQQLPEGLQTGLFSECLDAYCQTVMQVGLHVLEVREDFVSFDFTISHTRENGTVEYGEPIRRNFYIRQAY